MTSKRPNENAETSKINDRQTELLNIAVRDFVETRFNGDGPGFYQRFKKNVPLFGDFLSFLKTKSGYKNILPIASELGKKNNNSLFAGEIHRVTFALENLKKEVSERFVLEYDFSSLSNAREKSADLKRHIERMNVGELTELIASPTARFELLEGVLRKNPEFYRKDWQAYLDALQSETGFDEQDRQRLAKHLENVDWISSIENAKTAFKTGTVSQDEIQTIISLITSPKSKRALLRAVLPKVSLGELIRMKIVGRTEAEKRIEELIISQWEKGESEISVSLIRDANDRAKKSGGKNARSVRNRIIKDIVGSLDPNAVFVSTSSLSDEVVDVVLKKSDVSRIIEEKISAGMEELKNALGVEKTLETDKDGSSAVSFAKKIVSEFSGNDVESKNITWVEAFLESAKSQNSPSTILEGVVDAGSEAGWTKLRMKVLEWKEHSHPGERNICVNFLDESGASAQEDELSYEEFYRLIHRLENRGFYDEESIGRKIRIEDAGTKRIAAEMENATTDEEREAILSEAPTAEVRDLNELKDLFDDLDPNGTSHGFKAGMSVIFGKPESRGYNVITVESIDEQNNTLTIVDTRTEGNRRSSVPFGKFYSIARLLGATRSAGINSAGKFLDAMKNSLMKGYFEDLSVEDGEGGMKNFVPKNKRGQTGYEGVRVLYKPDGKAIQIGAMEDGRVEIRMLDSFDPGNQKEGVKPKGQFSSAFQWYGYETLYMLVREYGLGPYEGIAEDVKMKEPEFESKGTMKKLLNRPSFHDFIHGFQEIPKFIKKKLEHSSHHHAAHVTLALAEKIPGFPSDWLVDLQMEIHNEDKATLGKEVDRLNSFSSPKRHEQALRYLRNAGSHDYEIIAAALSLLEKHGNLYPGVLAKYEKDWLFYARMPGTMEEKKKFLQSKRFGPDGKEREVKEPEIIMLWLQELSKRAHHPISPYYWLEIKKRWYAGATGEFETWGKEAKTKETLLERADYAIGKFKGKEYAHGIGAMEEIWGKPNGLGMNVSARMRVPFVLAMSNVRKHIHSDLSQKFTGMFDAGHTYPPLLFIQQADRQDIFRKVIKRLSAQGGTDMAAAYAKIDRLMFESSVSLKENSNDEALILELDAFWKKYGDKLSQKLLVSVEDPQLLLEKEKYPEFAEYLEIVGGEYGNTKFDGTEIDCGTYEVGSANWSLMAPGVFVRQFKVQAGHGGLNSELEQYLFGTFKQSLNKIRETKYDDDANRDLEIKKRLFREYHLNFEQYIHTRLSSDKLAEDPNRRGSPKFANEPYMRQLTGEFGFTAKIPDEAVFEGAGYEAWLDSDFNRFMSVKSVKKYGNEVATNVDGIIDRNLFGGNDDDGQRNRGREPNSEELNENQESDSSARSPKIPKNSENGTDFDQSQNFASASLATNLSENNRPKSVNEQSKSNKPREDFRNHYAPIVDMIVDRFGRLPLEYAQEGSKEMKKALEKSGIPVPEDVTNTEWALSKIVERFLELQLHNFFSEEDGEEKFVGSEYLRYDDIHTRIGSEALASFRRGNRPNFDHIEDNGAKTYLRMLFRDGVKWEAEDLRTIGKILFESA